MNGASALRALHSAFLRCSSYVVLGNPSFRAISSVVT